MDLNHQLEPERLSIRLINLLYIDDKQKFWLILIYVFHFSFHCTSIYVNLG